MQSESITNTPLRYWVGNLAKARVMRDLLRSGARRVFDYGCGTLGDWPRIVRDTPGLTVVGYDPSPQVVARTRDRVAGLPITVLTGNALDQVSTTFDAIVSFSVLEHVRDRHAYLTTLRRLLSPGGVAYLNYDEGHFRLELDADRFATLWRVARAVARNTIFYRWPDYQRRVSHGGVEAEVRRLGFAIRASRYENIPAIKRVAARVPPERSVEFLAFWDAAETSLHDFADDDVARCRLFASRTLELVLADVRA